MNERLPEVLEACATVLMETARQLKEVKPEREVPPKPEPRPERAEKRDEWLTAREFEARYKISRPTLIRWRKEGKVKYLQMSEQFVRYRPLEESP